MKVKINKNIFSKMIKSQDGFLGMLAVVIIVVVGGGTIYTGTKIIKGVHEKGCGDAFGRWSSGQTYADLADGDNMEAIDEAMKCKDAVYTAIKVAKPVAGMMSGSTNIGVGVDNVATVFVDRIMDVVDNSSKPPVKNNPLPVDVKSVIKGDKEKEDGNSAGDKLSDFLDGVGEKIESMDVPSVPAVVDNSGVVKKVADSCDLGFSLNSSPKLKIECPDNPIPGSSSFVNIYYSDPEGDIKSLVLRNVINIPTYSGMQAGPWFTTPFEGNGRCGSDSSSAMVPSEFGLGEVKASFWFEAYLVDLAGNKSDIAKCKILEVN